MTLKRKIVILFSIFISVVLSISFYFMTSTVRAELVRENLEDMTRTSRMLVSVFEKGGVPALRETVTQLADWPGRVTYIASNGAVLYDSSGLDTDNHLKRPEIKKASEAGVGNSLRYSSTLRTHMNYHATKVASKEGSGFIRVAYPLSVLTRILQALLKRALLYIVLVILLSVLFWVWLTKRIFSPLEKIIAKAELIKSNSDVRFPLFRDIELQKLSIALNDMSARLQDADSNIRSRREELARIIEALPIGIVLTGINRSVRYLNNVARALLGDVGDVGKGTPVERLIPNREIYDMLDAPDARKIFFLPYKNGTWVDICTLTLESGRLLVISDMTEERRLEETRRNFIIEAGHDLQTPLTSIRAAAELLLENAVPEDAPLLNTVLRQQERMTSLIDDLLLLVKLDREAAKEEKRPEDLAALLKILLDEFKEDPAAHNLVFDVSLPERAPIHATRSEILRGLSNVLDNAVRKCNEKWGEKIGGVISVNLEARTDEWNLVIADNGPGISPEIEDQIFESFHSAGKTAGKWGSSGHGLGLSIAARVFGVHGGGIEFLRKPPLEGAAFRITLPKARSQNGEE